MEEKLQELSALDMKSFILELRPELKQSLQNISVEDVRAMYQAIVKEELEKDRNKLGLAQQSMQQGQDNRSNYHSETLNRQQISLKQSRLPSQRIALPRQLDHKEIATEEIRQFLIENLPQMKKQLATFDASELEQLYLELMPAKQPKFQEKKEDCDIEGFSSSKMKVSTKGIKQIHQNYQDCRYNRGLTERKLNRKSKISSFSSYLTNLTSLNNDPACLSPQSIPKKDGRRSQLKQLLPQQSDTIDILTDEQIKQLFLQQKQRKVSPPVESLPKVDRISPNLQAYQQSFQQSQFPKDQPQSILKQNQIREGEAFQFEHTEAGMVKARTFVFVHTVYENQKNINNSNQYKIKDCQCPCCKNNTIVNLYHQLKEYIDKYK